MLKKILLVSLVLFFNLLIASAEEKQIKETYKINGQIEYDDNPVETIYLEEDVEKPQVNIPQRTLKLPVGVLNITSNTNTSRSALARAMITRNDLGDILPLSDSVIEHTGAFSFGSKFGEEISYSQIESSASFFLRYDSPKYYSLETSFVKSANREIENSQWTSLKLTPEWHITDKLTLKDAFSSNMQTRKNKNEITLVYTPSLKKYADSLKFELGVAQSYYANGNRSESVSFSTGFKL